MYLWRFAIEHLFRFLKQPMGLNSHRSSNLDSLQRWIWIVALAYWQLLLMRNTVQPNRPAWHPQKKDGQDNPFQALSVPAGD
jgi:IS4 transposase